MYTNILRFSTMSVSVARKNWSAKLSHCQACAKIDRNASLIAGVIKGILICILKAAEG